jgi:meso-butanediol dehydrogenase / (S,S)-butanediol dehydrogenase / diacetyl reductase
VSVSYPACMAAHRLRAFIDITRPCRDRSRGSEPSVDGQSRRGVILSGPREGRRTVNEKGSSARVVMVTGAGRGIDRATAEAFAAEGDTVIVAELRPELGRRTERALVKSGARALFLRTDVSDSASVKETVRAVVHRFGRIDCLVNNNAGVLSPGELVKLPRRDLERMLPVNLRGPIQCARAVLPTMLRQRSGSIINVASQLGKVGIAEYATYCPSKFGVVGFTQALADEVAGAGIRVWAVCPGLVDTAMARQAGVSRGGRGGLIKAGGGCPGDRGPGDREEARAKWRGGGCDGLKLSPCSCGRSSCAPGLPSRS